MTDQAKRPYEKVGGGRRMTPKTLTKYFTFLDRLRESGATNMYGAGPWLERAFDLKREVATPILSKWMETFDREKSPADRAHLAL